LFVPEYNAFVHERLAVRRAIRTFANRMIARARFFLALVSTTDATASPAPFTRFHNLVGAAAGVTTVVLSGGVFQNALLLHDLHDALSSTSYDVWMNRVVPPNDGGLSLGQAALTLEHLSQ